MAVSSGDNIRTFNLHSADDGEPHGFFKGRVLAEGDASGGDLVATLFAQYRWSLGKLLLIKTIGYVGPDDGSDKFRIAIGGDYFNSNDFTVRSGVTVDGHENVAEHFKLDRLWMKEASSNFTAGILRLETLNIDTEDWVVEIHGVFWHLNKLRAAGVAPIIRWG